MQPINLTIPVTGNCDNLTCCIPSRKFKRKSRKEQKVQDVAIEIMEVKKDEKPI
jgi:hypothetical protein